MSEVLDFFNEEFSTVNRNDIFYTATHPVCSNNFLDFNQALIDVINEKNITLSELSAIQGPSITFDEFVIAYFLTNFEITLPIRIWTSLVTGFEPKINAAGSAVFLFSLILGFIAQFILLFKQSEKQNGIEPRET